MSNQAKISVVTPIHNGIGHTLKFLESLESVTYPNFETIIVDDGSTDNSAKIITESFPDVTVLKETGDLWWSGATNTGVKYALDGGAQYILTINNDVEVEPDFLTNLANCARKHQDSLVGAKIYELKSRKLWYYGGLVDWDKGQFYHNLDDKEELFKAEWLTGMGVLVNAEVFKKIGLYDAKNTPQYAGDLDFSMRAKKNGFQLLVCGGSVIYNDVYSCANLNYRKVQSLFALNSDNNLKLRAFIYKAHSPKPLKSFINYYARYFLGFLKKH